MKLFSFFNKKSTTSQSATPVITAPTTPQHTIPIATASDEPPTLQQRLSSAYPSRSGLYPHELLMLSYAPSYTIKENTFQHFWKWEYSVTDPQDVLDSLFIRGFIQQESHAQALSHLTVPQLKALLASVGEKLSGNKTELITRILDNFDGDKLCEAIPVFRFALTAKGEEEIKQNEYVLYLHRSRYMSAWEMNRLLHEDNPSHLQYRDIIWREFNRKLSLHFQNGDYGLYRSVFYQMHSFLCEEGKYKSALIMLLNTVSYDLSGLGNASNLKPNYAMPLAQEILYKHHLVNIYSEDKVEVIPYPGITQSGKKLFEALDMPTDDFIAFVYQECTTIKIHERVFSAEECANIFLASIGLEERRLINSYEVAKQRLCKRFKLKKPPED